MNDECLNVLLGPPALGTLQNLTIAAAIAKSQSLPN
jgi:hypothetical protein